MAVVNSYILFREHQAQFPDDPALHCTKDYSLAYFREVIVRKLCGFPEYDQPPLHAIAKPAKPVPDLGKNRTEHVPIVSPDRKSCVVCLQDTKMFKGSNLLFCPQLYITQDKNCFHIFHNADEYRHKDDGGDDNDE